MKKLENDPRLQEVMYSVLQCEIQKEDAYIARIKQDTTPVPDTLLIRLKNLLDDYYQKDKKRKKIRHVFLIAAIIAVLALGACVAIEPLREFVFGAIITKYEEYFDFQWNTESTADKNASEYPYIPSKFGYVPDGYEIVEEVYLPKRTYIRFEKTYNDYIVYEVIPVRIEVMHDINYALSSEKINEIDVVILEEGNNYQLLWFDEYYSYRLNGFVSKNELVGMLESLK